MSSPTHSLSPPLVSVVIPVFNRAEMLGQAVESVLSQTYPRIELIIVDDGSTDNTSKVAKKYAHDYKHVCFERIDNVGPGGARQHGLDLARGEYVQFLDSDDLLASDKLALQVEMLSEYPNADVCYCKQDLISIDGKLIEKDWMRTNEVHSAMFPAMLSGRVWGTPVPLYTKSLLNKAGKWSTLSNLEDWEYDCRVAVHSNGLCYVNKTLVQIRRHDEPHFGDVDKGDNKKVIDRATAMLSIANSAKIANISHSDPNYHRFIRNCFLVSRQTSLLGYAQAARRLIVLCSAHTTATLKQKFEYKSYRLLASFLGWKRMGKLSAMIDRRRS